MTPCYVSRFQLDCPIDENKLSTPTSKVNLFLIHSFDIRFFSSRLLPTNPGLITDCDSTSVTFPQAPSSILHSSLLFYAVEPHHIR